MRQLALARLASVLALLGCGPTGDEVEANRSAAGMANAVGGTTTASKDMGTLGEPASESRGAMAELIGRWVGPEGLFAEVEPAAGNAVRVTMQYDLDHRGTFEGTVVGDTIRLTGRPDGPVTLTRGSGAETGMKWVDPAADCLTAIVGKEAYCRPEA